MATAQQLEAQKILVSIEVELDPDEIPQRWIYGLPRVYDWMKNVLPGLETDGYIPGANRPDEQVDALLYSLISGRSAFEMPPHSMDPEAHGVWELRTHDVRFFGFFWRKGVFIATAVDTKSNCEKHKLYTGYRNECVFKRNQLDLDSPKFVEGSNLEDVL